MTAIAEETSTETSKEERTQAVRPPGVSAVSGIVDLGEGRGFLRTAGYRRSGDDIPVTPAQVRRYGLRPGDQVEGTAGNPQANPSEFKSNLSAAGQEKARQGKASQGTARQDRTLLTVESVNGLPVAQAGSRPRFDDLTPVYPSQRFRLEDGDPSPTARIIDLVSPIGKGQRGLIVAPPKAGKTTVLKTIARAIGAAYPAVHVMLVLVGERP